MMRDKWEFSTCEFKKTIVAIGREACFDHIIRISSDYYRDNDWKKRAAALIILAGIGEEYGEPEKLSRILEIGEVGLQDTKKQVRKAAWGLLNKLKKFRKAIDIFEKFLKEDFSLPVNGLRELCSVVKTSSNNVLAVYYEKLISLLKSVLLEKSDPSDSQQFVRYDSLDIAARLGLACKKKFTNDWPEV
ncbi:hypothetical protein PMAYCL1PPCAC_02815, partial [Pristionchus mayeri]